MTETEHSEDWKAATAKERERCARLCESKKTELLKVWKMKNKRPPSLVTAFAIVYQDCADEIRGGEK